MDRCLGWSGICIEANSKYFELIHRERSCALVPTCVSAREGETVEFALSGPGSGIISTHRQGSQIMDNAKLVERKKCVTIRTQLERYGVNVIDYFNLDVEGGELNVLKSIDWNHTIIKIISVEISGSSEQPIHLFLTQLGFVKIDNELPVNDLPGMPIYRTNKFYAHSSVQFGRPWLLNDHIISLVFPLFHWEPVVHILSIDANEKEMSAKWRRRNIHILYCYWLLSLN